MVSEIEILSFDVVMKECLIDSCRSFLHTSYIVTLPFLYLFAKSSEAAIQSVLHALFLPNIIKIAEKPDPLAPKTATGKQATKEFIQGGMLYAECERVRLPGDAEKRFGDEEGGQQIWENLELELAEWRKSEVKTSNEDQRAPKI